MPFTPLKRILPQAIRQAGLDVQVSAARIVDEAHAALVRLWDAERAAYVRAVSFKEGVLKVTVTSPSAAHALRLAETAWMNEINRALGARKVMKVTVVREGF
ncbi:MAG TPA: DciA family protein [Candidatus Methylomirabilis sp.]|nr:DciA family protein [Candidatus Methylomirabilis sp.]